MIVRSFCKARFNYDQILLETEIRSISSRNGRKAFFQIDPQTRRADIVRGLKLMTPDAAVALVDQVKQSGEWETQRREEWQAVWKPQVITISVDDAYKVQIVGHQWITKPLSVFIHHAGRQIICTLPVRADTAHRTEDNQNTGFRVAG